MFEKLLGNLDWLFICLGLPAQLLFTSRFVVQWIESERQGKSVMPLAFWYFSISGSIGLLAYGLLRGEPILVLGQALGSVIYLRNLVLIHKPKKVLCQQGQTETTE